ncbi:hypothetical protein HDU96_005369, partial [Phlyctochytrium bullatum]
MVALYLSTRTMHFVCRYIWQRHIERLVFGRKTPVALLEDLEAAEKQPKKHHHHNHKQKRNNHARGDSNDLNGGGLELRRLPAPSDIPVMEVPKPAEVVLREEAERKEIEKIRAVRKNIRNAAGTIVMMLSSSQILYAYVCEPQSLAKSYLSFLLTHGGVRALMPERARDYLETMGEVIKAAPKAATTKYLPLREDPALPPPLYSSTVPEGLPVDRLVPYA